MRISVPLAALILLAICVAALAEQPGVQEPKPSVPQTKSTGQTGQTNAPPIIVNVVPAAKTKADVAEEAKDRAEKAETDRKLADYTGELAFFTKGLFIATVVLGIATVGLLVLGFFQSRDTRTGVKAAQDSADAAKAASEAAQISARAAFRVELPVITMDPPELLSITGAMPDGPYGGSSLHGLPYENCAISGVEFLNHGRTSALPTGLSIGFCVALALPPTPVMLKTVPFSHRAIIRENGGTFEPQIHFDFGLSDNNRKELANGSTLWLWVSLAYDDFMLQTRTVMFIWRWGRLPEDADNESAYHFIPNKRVSAVEREVAAMLVDPRPDWRDGGEHAE